MSFECMAWAVKQSQAKGTRKLVLLMIANYASAEDGTAYPSVQRLAKDCGLSSRTIISSIQELEDLGLIESLKRFANGMQRSNIYRVLMGENPALGGENSSPWVRKKGEKRGENSAHITSQANQSLEPEKSGAKEPRPTNGTRLPDDWSLPEDWHYWARGKRPDLNISEEADKFADYWQSQPGAKGRKADWMKTWRNWIRNAHAPRQAPIRDEYGQPLTIDERMRREKAKRAAQESRTIDQFSPRLIGTSNGNQ